MSGFKLTKQYLTGIPSIDAQHKILVGMINDLSNAMAQGENREFTGKILRKLIAYTESHFAMEEAMMREYDYPDYAMHVAGHKKLINRVMTFEDMLNKGMPNVGVEVLNFLQEWLLNHILITDMAYVPCVTGHMPTPASTKDVNT